MSKATIVSPFDLEKAHNRPKKKDLLALAKIMGKTGAKEMQMYFECQAKQLRRTK